MKVADIARRAGVTPETVRHYVRIGLLTPQRNPDNSYRVFSRADLDRLRFARRASQLGFKLDEIKEIFAVASLGDSPCPGVREILIHRIDETRRTVAALQALQSRMESALSEWEKEDNLAPTGNSICHLIENWHE